MLPITFLRYFIGLNSCGLKKLNQYGLKVNSLANVLNMQSALIPMAVMTVNVTSASSVMVFNATISMNVQTLMQHRLRKVLPK